MAFGKWAGDPEDQKRNVRLGMEGLKKALAKAQDALETMNDDDGDWGAHGKGSTFIKSALEDAKSSIALIKRFGGDLNAAEAIEDKIQMVKQKYDAKIAKAKMRAAQEAKEAPRLKAEGRDKDKFTKFGS